MSQDTPMWNFALECVSEGVIIASCDERSRSSIKIGYANRHASRILSCVQEEILDSQIFQAEKFRESFMLSIKSQQNIQIVLNEVKITISPFDNTQVVVVLVSIPREGTRNPLFIPLAEQTERARYLEYFNQISSARCVIGEHITETNDIKVKFLSLSSIKHTKLLFEKAKDKLYFEDLKMKTIEETRNAMIKVDPEHPRLQLDAIPVTSADSEERWISPCIHYLGENENHRRIVAIISEEITCSMRLKNSIELHGVYAVLKTLYDYAPIALGSVLLNEAGDDGIYTSLNPTSFNWFNVSNPIGMKLSDLVPKELLSLWLETFYKALREGTKSATSETKFESKNSEKKHFQSYVILPTTERSFCFISTDITHRIKLEEELRRQKENLELEVKERTAALQEALKTKSRFLSIMSHEMRTPMNGLLGMISLVSDTNLTSEQKEMIRIAELCGQTLMNVINDILDLSKLEAMNFQLEYSDVDIQALIENSLEIIANDVEKKNIELIWEIDPAVPSKIVGDIARLRQILVNLLSNACKFSTKGNIVVTVTSKLLPDKEKYEIQFSVKDEGIGISSEARMRLLDPFTQLDSGSTRKFGGVGLGLTISKKLVTLMGGSLWFDSEVGVGSTFHFTIITRGKFQTLKTPTYESDSNFTGRVAIVALPLMLSQMIKKLIENNLHAVVVVFDTLEDFLKSNIELRCAIFNDRAEWRQVKRCPVVVAGYAKCEDYPFLRKPIKKDALLELVRKYLGSFDGPKQELSPRNSGTSTSILKLKILVAEDNALNQIIIKRLLTSEGYTDICLVENGLQAVSAVKTQNFDVILMDIMMPEMDGEQATAVVRKELKKSMPIVALTAHVSKDYVESGFNIVFPKPIDRKKLSEYLRELNDKLYK